MTKQLTRWYVFGIGILAAAGCQKMAERQAEFWQPEEQPRSVQHLFDQQAAVGARRDGMLHACHFSAAELNSLGRAKLDAMASDNDTAFPLNVYLDVEELQKERRSSVEKYLKDCGLATAQIRVHDGINPLSTGSAAKGLAAEQAAPAAQPTAAETGTPSATVNLKQ
jgi:hypothetical protein